MNRTLVGFAYLTLLVMPPTVVSAEETLDGPVTARVVEVLDGDTIAFQAHVWLGTDIAMHVRIRGIDTAELHATCAEEKTLAEAAKGKLIALAGNTIRLTRIAYDKYGGRVDADVANAAGIDLASAMLKAGLAHAYDGSGARADWCPVGSTRK